MDLLRVVLLVCVCLVNTADLQDAADDKYDAEGLPASQEHPVPREDSDPSEEPYDEPQEDELEVRDDMDVEAGCPALSEKIIGGRASSVVRHPYQVSMVINGNSFCGGFIVSPVYVLTAAHCVQNTSPERIRLRVGSTRRDAGGSVVRVANVTAHPQYGRPRFDSDIAVLGLARPLALSATVRPLRLPRAGQRVPLVRLTVTGWGLTAVRGRRIPRALREARVPVVPHWLCRLSYGATLTDNMFCGGHFLIGGVSSCQVYEMFLMGYKFKVLSPIFTIHWGLQSRRQRPLWRERQNQRNRRVFETVKRELYARYRKDPLHLIKFPRKAKKS